MGGGKARSCDQNIDDALFSPRRMVQGRTVRYRCVGVCGLDYLLALLEGAKCEIESCAYISETLRKKVFAAFCFWDYGFALACLSATPTRAGMRAGMTDPLSKTEPSNADVIAMIENRLERLGAFKEYVTEREELALDAEARTFSLPSVDATARLLRYEAHLDRQLYRAMDQLERLQQQRKGENVPAPLNVNLGRRA